MIALDKQVVHMYVNVRCLAGGLIKQTTAAANWSVRLQRICRSQCVLLVQCTIGFWLATLDLRSLFTIHIDIIQSTLEQVRKSKFQSNLKL